MRKSENKSKISNDPKGLLVILSAPSGCGKTTILDRLLKRHPDWFRSISVTTRPPRTGEKKGKDYHFVSLKEFEELKKNKEFLESAKVFGHYYGTRKSAVKEAVQKGEIAILAIDVQGHRLLRKNLEKKISSVSIFVLPPSISVLRERLEKRCTDAPAEINKRIQGAEEEIKAAKEYDGTVVNHDLDQTVHEIEEIVYEHQKNHCMQEG